MIDAAALLGNSQGESFKDETFKIENSESSLSEKKHVILTPSNDQCWIGGSRFDLMMIDTEVWPQGSPKWQPHHQLIRLHFFEDQTATMERNVSSFFLFSASPEVFVVPEVVCYIAMLSHGNSMSDLHNIVTRIGTKAFTNEK